MQTVNISRQVFPAAPLEGEQPAKASNRILNGATFDEQFDQSQSPDDKKPLANLPEIAHALAGQATETNVENDDPSEGDSTAESNSFAHSVAQQDLADPIQDWIPLPPSSATPETLETVAMGQSVPSIIAPEQPSVAETHGGAAFGLGLSGPRGDRPDLALSQMVQHSPLPPRFPAGGSTNTVKLAAKPGPAAWRGTQVEAGTQERIRTTIAGSVPNLFTTPAAKISHADFAMGQPTSPVPVAFLVPSGAVADRVTHTDTDALAKSGDAQAVTTPRTTQDVKIGQGMVNGAVAGVGTDRLTLLRQPSTERPWTDTVAAGGASPGSPSDSAANVTETPGVRLTMPTHPAASLAGKDQPHKGNENQYAALPASHKIAVSPAMQQTQRPENRDINKIGAPSPDPTQLAIKERATLDFAPESGRHAPLAPTNAIPDTGQPAPMTAGMTRYETARAVAVQMANVFPGQPGKTVEISLSPEELGRVRMVLSPSDSGLTVSITVDRHETLDLMRRHADQLSAELRRMGYDNIGFDFNGSGAGGPDHQHKYNPQVGELADVNGLDPETHIPAKTARKVASGGLDLRL